MAVDREDAAGDGCAGGAFPADLCAVAVGFVVWAWSSFLPSFESSSTLVAEIKRVLEDHPGDSAVMLHVEDGRRTTALRLGPGFCVDGGNAVHAELRVLLGADAVF